MTETEWLSCIDPSRLLAFVGSIAGRRRLLLFAAAACGDRDRSPSATNGGQPGTIGAVVLTRGTPGLAGEPAEPPRQSSHESPADLILAAHRAAYMEATAAGGDTDFMAIRAIQADQLRDIVGNPFRPTRFDARWRTVDVIGLARGIDADRAFDRLPLLADALMDAGCEVESVLHHCRSAGPHVRGCWVVDLTMRPEDEVE